MESWEENPCPGRMQWLIVTLQLHVGKCMNMSKYYQYLRELLSFLLIKLFTKNFLKINEFL